MVPLFSPRHPIGRLAGSLLAPRAAPLRTFPISLKDKCAWLQSGVTLVAFMKFSIQPLYKLETLHPGLARLLIPTPESAASLNNASASLLPELWRIWRACIESAQTHLIGDLVWTPRPWCCVLSQVYLICSHWSGAQAPSSDKTPGPGIQHAAESFYPYLSR